jgi:hypothetical protein
MRILRTKDNEKLKIVTHKARHLTLSLFNHRRASCRASVVRVTDLQLLSAYIKYPPQSRKLYGVTIAEQNNCLDLV